MSLIRVKQPTILDKSGKPVLLNAKERAHAEWTQRLVNDRFQNAGLGYEVSITTLTTIVKLVSEQKFFEVPPADYIPIKVGEGAWSSNLTTFRSFDLSDTFETGVLNTGGNNARLATADAAIDSVNIQIYNWAKAIGWNIIELEQASRSGSWDLVTAKEESRKKNWDLGIQRIAFLGASGMNGAGGTCLGLLNQPGITTNTALITAPISSLTSAQLKTLLQSLLEAYRSNCNRTAWPTHFIIPESDYNGLASQSSPDFPIKSTLELMEEALKLITRNKNFKILPLAYADKAYSGLSTQMYVFLNYDEKSLKMTLPVDYTNTLANSLDNFNFQNTAYGQFSGVLAIRPLEMMYFVY